MIDEIMKQILAEFSEEKVCEMLDEEILNWTESGWEDGEWDNEYDWYSDFGRGEAEYVIITQIKNWWRETYQGTELYQQYKKTKDSDMELEEAISTNYSPLNQQGT